VSIQNTRRRFPMILPFLALAALVALPATAMDVDELIAKNIDAQGGLEALKAIQSVRATGKALAQGMEFPFTMQQERPDHLRLDIEVMGMQMVQAYDGDDAWTINPMTGSQDPQPMGELEAKSFKMQADMDGLLVGYEKKGFTVAYAGEADVEGTPTHQLTLDTGQGIVIDMYMDAEYFLNIKQSATITWEGRTITQDTYFSDFKEVGDLIMPHAIETRMGETTVSQIVLESVEHGVEVEPGIFAMPEPAAAEADAPADDK
jgi:hypothetical protein